MDTGFFETLESARVVDRLLFWVAVFLPLFASGLAFVLREETVVTRNRHRWVLACLAGPAILILWSLFNRVADRFGLDSVRGLIINAAIFAVAGLLFTGLRILLRALITEPPPPKSITASIPTQRFTTSRMRSLDPETGRPAELGEKNSTAGNSQPGHSPGAAAPRPDGSDA